MNTTQTPPMLHTTKEAARLLGMSYNTVRNMMSDGRIQVVRPSKNPRIPHAEIVRLSTPKPAKA